jgi:hypothetical protein
MQARSRKVEMPSGLSLPLAFGMNTLHRDPEHLRARQHDIGGAGVIRRCARGARWREFAGLVRHVLHPRRIGSLFGRWGAWSLFLEGFCISSITPGRDEGL